MVNSCLASVHALESVFYEVATMVRVATISWGHFLSMFKVCQKPQRITVSGLVSDSQ